MNKLEETRKELGLNQKQCADYLGVSLRTYQRYELDNYLESGQIDDIVAKISNICHSLSYKHFENNGKLKLLIIVGTRPEIIRLAAVINKCREYFDTLLAHTGQNYDYNLNGVFFKDLKIKDPDIYLNAVGKDLGETMGNIIAKSYELIVEIKPDAVLVLGDTNSCLSVIGAKRLHIPIFHMEAGNRCKDECLPEETNRRIVDIISDVNLAYSEHARRYLADSGLPKERTYVTGSPMAEVLHQNIGEIESSDILNKLSLEKGKYILLSAHREENIDTEKNFNSLFSAINKMAKIYDMPILYSCHPRSRKRLEATGFKLDPRVVMHEPLGFHDYNNLQMNAFCVVSDSGTLPEESSFYASIGKPIAAVCIRTSTERPEALDDACFVLAGIDEKNLLQAVEVAINNKAGCHPVDNYIDTNVSDKVVKLIQSYVGVVNKMVWRKE
ncbi:MAG: UDP-N-acetylglucosamine 2-epimerase (non-hydrolyzing) [Bacilli bacterium]|nr:UDP-N-acetylglucosamine 2-epimerase (non-hydrolyzing) [Bacilli bacterium]